MIANDDNYSQVNLKYSYTKPRIFMRTILDGNLERT